MKQAEEAFSLSFAAVGAAADESGNGTIEWYAKKWHEIGGRGYEPRSKSHMGLAIKLEENIGCYLQS
jgi:hypothetical protein